MVTPHPASEHHPRLTSCRRQPLRSGNSQVLSMGNWISQQGKHNQQSARLAVPRTCVTRPAWTGSVAASTSREELLPWIICTTIPTSFVTRSAWARSTATASRREHLLGKSRTSDQGNRCQNARKNCWVATHKIDGKRHIIYSNTQTDHQLESIFDIKSAQVRQEHWRVLGWSYGGKKRKPGENLCDICKSLEI